MPLLTRAQILAAEDIESEIVEVPEWGGSVRVRGLTGTQRDRFEQSIVIQQGKKSRMNMDNIRAKLCAMTMVDEDGGRLFSDRDTEELGAKSAAALDRVFAVAQRLSGISEDDLEELEKNSGSAPSGASTSA